MSRSEREKGKRGEREVASLLRARGFDGARRGRQYAGHPEAPDVLGVPGCHLEVKYREKLNVPAAYEQARAEAGCAVAVLIHRRSRGRWLVTVALDDWQPPRGTLPLQAGVENDRSGGGGGRCGE